MNFRDLLESKEEGWVLIDDSHLPNSIDVKGKVWGVSNSGVFIKAVQLDSFNKWSKYAFKSKKEAETMAKNTKTKFGTFKVFKVTKKA